jgi:hypothetical protein
MAKTKSVTSQFKGKTIKRVDSTTVCNMWTFHFTDGTKIGVETEGIGMGLWGLTIVPASDLAPNKRKPR